MDDLPRVRGFQGRGVNRRRRTRKVERHVAAFVSDPMEGARFIWNKKRTTFGVVNTLLDRDRCDSEYGYKTWSITDHQFGAARMELLTKAGGRGCHDQQTLRAFRGLAHGQQQP